MCKCSVTAHHEVLTCRTCGTVRIERFCKGINICIAALSRMCIVAAAWANAMCVLPLSLGDAMIGGPRPSRPNCDAQRRPHSHLSHTASAIGMVIGGAFRNFAEKRSEDTHGS